MSDIKDELQRTAHRLMLQVQKSRATQPAAPAQKPPSEPIPLEPEFETADIETWWLPEPVAAWCEACHAAYGVPRVMAVAAALCCAATVTQGAVSVEVKPGWREPLSLYWLVFSPTGTRKSALLRAATAPIRALQDARRRELEPEIRQRTNEKARLEQQIARMRRATKAHRYTEGAQQHLQELRELEHELDECVIPKPPRWLYDDINPTIIPRKLGYSQEAEGIARLAVLDAEGTFLANLLGRHSGHVNVDPLLKGYQGEPIDMVRAVHGSRETQDTHLDAAHLTLLLLVQPHYLDELRAKPELGSNGLLGRCLMSHLSHAVEPLPWDAPEVPSDVQEGYARWLATLAAIEPGTIWQVPPELRSQLKAMHDNLELDRVGGKGAVGWTVRTLGRICRILALSELSDCPRQNGGAARTRVTSKLTYLYNYLYSRGVAQARAVEPTSEALPRLTRRALRWLRQLTVPTVELRQLCRGLTIKKDVGLALSDSLVESGHLEQLAPTVRANKTLTVSYRIISTDPEAEPPKPKPFLASLPTGAELDDEAQPPEGEEYLGAEDFES